MATYISRYKDIMTVNKFIQLCKQGSLTDDMGFGFPAIYNDVNHAIKIKPSNLDIIPDKATSVVWIEY